MDFKSTGKRDRILSFKKKKNKVLRKFKPLHNCKVFEQDHYFVIFDYYFITGDKGKG